VIDYFESYANLLEEQLLNSITINIDALQQQQEQMVLS
jgi:hypothetical protein